jgi:hypothetical protein
MRSIKLKLILFVKLVVFFGRLVEKKKKYFVKNFLCQDSQTSAIKVFINVALMKSGKILNIVVHKRDI